SAIMVVSDGRLFSDLRALGGRQQRYFDVDFERPELRSIFKAADIIPYIIAQVVGAVVAAAVLYLIASGKPGFEVGGFAANVYGDLSPTKYSLLSWLVCEVVCTFIFLSVILGATHGRAPVGFAPLAIGLALTLIHLISIPVTNTSVNPARSLGPALFAGSAYMAQLWLFWLAPIVGAVVAGFASRLLQPADPLLEAPVEGTSNGRVSQAV